MTGASLAKKLMLGLMLMALIAPSSCAKRDQAEADEVTRATHLTDQGQHSEAIYILEARLKRQAHDNRARVVLASAYASRAGIALASYKDFAGEIVKWNQPEDRWSEREEASFLLQIAWVAGRVQRVLKAFDAIPSPATPEAKADLERAVEVLDIEAGSNGGPYLYRGLLRAALFRKAVLDGPRFQAGSDCLVKAEEAVQWLGELESELQLIFSDVALGVSEEATKKDLKSIAEQLHLGVDDLASELKESGVEKDIKLQALFAKTAVKCE